MTRYYTTYDYAFITNHSTFIPICPAILHGFTFHGGLD